MSTVYPGRYVAPVTRRPPAIIAAVLLAALTGCGGDAEPTAAPSPSTKHAQVVTGALCESVDATAVDQAGVTLTCIYAGGKATWQTNPSPSPSPSPLTSSSSAADPYAPKKFGQTYTAAEGIATSTVYAYRQPVARSAPRPDEQAGYEWGAVDVKVCASKTVPVPGITVSHSPWSLVYADDSQIEPSSTGYGQFPQPDYPWGEKQVAPGRCVRGWITFPVPAKKRPVAVEYAPTGEPVAPRWTVK